MCSTIFTKLNNQRFVRSFCVCSQVIFVYLIGEKTHTLKTIQKTHFEEIEIFHFSYHETGCRAMSSQKFSKLPIEFYHPSENSQLETATKLTIETASQSLRMEKVYFTSFSSYLSYFGKTPRMVKVILVLVKHVVKHFWPSSCVWVVSPWFEWYDREIKGERSTRPFWSVAREPFALECEADRVNGNKFQLDDFNVII